MFIFIFYFKAEFVKQSKYSELHHTSENIDC